MIRIDDEGQLRTDHGTRRPLPARANGAAADLGLAIRPPVSGGSSTALLLGQRRSHAIGADCPRENDRHRTQPATTRSALCPCENESALKLDRALLHRARQDLKQQ